MAMDFAALSVRIGANIQDLSAGLQQASGQLQGFVQKNQQAIRSLGIAFTATGVAIVGGLGLAVKSAGAFERSVVNAASVTGYAGEEFLKAKDKIAELASTLGETTVFSANEAANAMYDLASKGFKPAEMSVRELQPFLDLAAATQSELAMTTETVTATIRAFGLTTEESSRVADVFSKTIGSSAATLDKLSISMSYVGPIARTAGMSLEETAAALGKIYDIGFPASMAGTALRKAIAELLKPSEKLNKTLTANGLVMDDVNIKTHGLVGVLKNFDEAGVKSTEVMELFGVRSGPVVQALLEVGSSGKKVYEEMGLLNEALEDAAGTAEQMAKQQLDSLWGSMKLLKSAIESLSNTIGKMFIPMVRDVLDFITEIVRGMVKWMKLHPELAKGIMMAVGALGALSLVIGGILLMLAPMAILLSSIATMFVAMTAQAGALGVSIGALAAKFSILKLVMAGAKGAGHALLGMLANPMTWAIAAVVAGIALMVKGWWELKAAQMDVVRRQRELSNISQNALNKDKEAVLALRGAYAELHEEFKPRYEEITKLIAEEERLVKLMEEEVNNTEANRQALMDVTIALRSRTNALRDDLEARQKSVDKQKEQQELERSEGQLLGEYTDKLRELNKELVGGLDPAVYAERFVTMRNELGELLGDMDKATKMLSEIEESDPQIDIKLNIYGAEEAENLSDRILKLNQQIVREQLTGIAKRQQ
ncbi:phage tail tape measure protein, partial [Candidatus Omnitrophota bacterium]